MRKYSPTPNIYILFHATRRLALREWLLEAVALRVRVRVAVLLRVGLLVGEAEGVPPAARLEEEGAVEGAREGMTLDGREGVPVALA